MQISLLCRPVIHFFSSPCGLTSQRRNVRWEKGRELVRHAVSLSCAGHFTEACEVWRKVVVLCDGNRRFLRKLVDTPEHGSRTALRRLLWARDEQSLIVLQPHLPESRAYRDNICVSPTFIGDWCIPKAFGYVVFDNGSRFAGGTTFYFPKGEGLFTCTDGTKKRVVAHLKPLEVLGLE